MPFHHIVTAYDGSPQSQTALEHAVGLVRSMPGTRLTVIHVYRYPNFVFGEAMIPAPVRLEMEEMDEAERVLDEAEQYITDIPYASAVLLNGDPAHMLLEYAAEHAADLIVIGSRGLGTIGELFLGSVSHYVVQHAAIPVLVIKRPPGHS